MSALLVRSGPPLTRTDTNFIQQKLPEGSTTGAGGKDGQSGALGMDQRASTGITTFNQFWQYLMPLFGAYVADQYCSSLPDDVYSSLCVKCQLSAL